MSEQAKVYYSDLRCRPGVSLLDKLKKLIRRAGIGEIDFDHKLVAIKMHFGEPGNLAFLRPNYAKAVADVVKELGGIPFLTDCNTLYPGRRKNALEHLDAAYENGFTPLSTGCQVIIGDGLRGNDDVEVPVAGAEYIQTAKIGKAIMEADVVISLSHFKGHEQTGFGGAIKNIAIGIASSYNLCGPSGDLTAMGSKEAVLADGSVHHVRVVGILQDQTADGGLAGLSFLFDEAVSFHSWNSSDFNDSGWESSNLRTFVLNDLAATLPQDISSQIVPVVKLTNNFGGTDSGTLPTSVVTSTVDRLWVPSYVELAGSSEENALWGPAYGTGAFTWCNPIVASEGTQYDLFSQLGITAYQPNQSLVRRFDGSSTSWWLRSAHPHLVNDALCVGPDGNPSDDATPMNRFGVVPGFCI